MITIEKDKKSDTVVLTTTNSEGFHRQLYLTPSDLQELIDYAVKVYNGKIAPEK
jgi:hypothetical protein